MDDASATTERRGAAPAAMQQPAHVVHVVGPDLRLGAPTKAEAVAALVRAYGNVLREV